MTTISKKALLLGREIISQRLLPPTREEVLEGASNGEIHHNEGNRFNSIWVGLASNDVIGALKKESEGALMAIEAALEEGSTQSFFCSDCKGDITDANFVANPTKPVCDGCREKRRIKAMKRGKAFA